MGPDQLANGSTCGFVRRYTPSGAKKGLEVSTTEWAYGYRVMLFGLDTIASLAVAVDNS